MSKVITGLLLLAGVIHLLPVSGVLSAERLSMLYGVAIEDPNLVIMMRHRAVLFALLAVFMLYGAFKPALQPWVIVVGLVSTASFVVLAWEVGGYNEAIRRVVWADILAVAALGVAGGLYLVRRML